MSAEANADDTLTGLSRGRGFKSERLHSSHAGSQVASTMPRTLVMKKHTICQ